MAEMICACVEIPKEAILVPLPTINRHIRERGFDHTYRLARQIARIKEVRVGRFLKRTNNTTQVGATEEMRKRQAKTAYEVGVKIDVNKSYILLDDV